MSLIQSDVIIIGGGAAGLMCAIEAGKRGRKVIVLEHSNKVGKKILMSGGGRCNFTNYNIIPDNYISHTKDFCKSALMRYTQWDFIEFVKKHKIPFHEKTLGQLFCDNKSKDIVDMLLAECQKAAVTIYLETKTIKIDKNNHFLIHTNRGNFQTKSLVISSGGLSIPTMGASPFGYKIAEQFGIPVWPTRAGLVPFTLHTQDKENFSRLSGVSVDSIIKVENKKPSFRENILFTHRGLSGPAILQISSYWQPGETLIINLLPDIHLIEYLKKAQQSHPQKQLHSILAELLPKHVVEVFLEVFLSDNNGNHQTNKNNENHENHENHENIEYNRSKTHDRKMQSFSLKEFEQVSTKIQAWRIKPNGTEGYRTAEVTLGGVDCAYISSKTMETKHTPGLYFIGEVLDVTGWLGGYNFQWAWSSGWAAGQAV